MMRDSVPSTLVIPMPRHPGTVFVPHTNARVSPSGDQAGSVTPKNPFDSLIQVRLPPSGSIVPALEP